MEERGGVLRIAMEWGGGGKSAEEGRRLRWSGGESGGAVRVAEECDGVGRSWRRGGEPQGDLRGIPES